jgi:XTP/dITP diphosphohydrolase
VFGSTVAETAGEVSKNWEQLKMSEKGGNETILSGVPVSLPSLIKAYRMQEKAANVGFDWDKKEDVWAKVREEIAEVEAEMERGDKVNMEKEFGDLLFSLVNAARLYGVNPDTALEQCNVKFRRRFNFVEESSIAMKKDLSEMTLAEMDALWNEAKAKGL